MLSIRGRPRHLYAALCEPFKCLGGLLETPPCGPADLRRSRAFFLGDHLAGMGEFAPFQWGECWSNWPHGAIVGQTAQARPCRIAAAGVLYGYGGQSNENKGAREAARAAQGRSGPITVENDHELRLAAQAALTTVRRIKGKIEDETDSAERRRVGQILQEHAAQAAPTAKRPRRVSQLVSPQMVEQIATILLVADELRGNGLDTQLTPN